MSLPPVNLESTLALAILSEKKARQKDMYLSSFLLYKQESTILLILSSHLTVFTQLLGHPDIWISSKEQENDSLFSGPVMGHQVQEVWMLLKVKPGGR